VRVFARASGYGIPAGGWAGRGRPSHVNHTTNSLGLADKINDGREAYMRDTISACLIELIGTTGATRPRKSCTTRRGLNTSARLT
jgi:hypothetical protein